MKRLPPALLTFSAIAAGLFNIGLRPDIAAAAAMTPPSPLSATASAPNSAVLMAQRLGRFRFQVRPSRFRLGGFSRGGCLQNTTLTPLTPVVDSAGDSLETNAAAYLTASDHPTFLFHISALPPTIGRLTLKRSDLSPPQRPLYEIDFDLSGKAGIVGVQLPDNGPPLEVGAKYVWQVSVLCDPDAVESVTALGGVVERVPDIVGGPDERLNFYLDQGIWQDAVALMARKVYANPSDAAIAREFSSLLQDVGLSEIAQAPIIQLTEEDRQFAASTSAPVAQMSTLAAIQPRTSSFRVRPSPFRRVGFSRGAFCPEGQEITAMTPFVTSEGDRLGDTAPTYLTASHHPTLFIHVPPLPATQGVLTIHSQDAAATAPFFYRAEFELSGQSGIVGIRTPKDAPPLEAGVEYVWRVSIACTPGSIRNRLTAHGGVLELTTFNLESVEMNLDTYLEAGVWQEALTILAEARYANRVDAPNADIESDWRRLMDTAGLSDFADEPIVQIVDAN